MINYLSDHLISMLYCCGLKVVNLEILAILTFVLWRTSGFILLVNEGGASQPQTLPFLISTDKGVPLFAPTTN